MDTFVRLDEFAKKDWAMHQLREQWVTWKAPWFNRKSTLMVVEINSGFH